MHYFRAHKDLLDHLDLVDLLDSLDLEESLVSLDLMDSEEIMDHLDLQDNLELMDNQVYHLFSSQSVRNDTMMDTQTMFNSLSGTVHITLVRQWVDNFQSIS